MTVATTPETILTATPNSLTAIKITINALPSPHLFEAMMKNLIVSGIVRLSIRPTEVDAITRALTLAGFVNVKCVADDTAEMETVIDEPQNKNITNHAHDHTTQVPYIIVQATKPSYASGTSAPLSFANKSSLPSTVSSVLPIHPTPIGTTNNSANAFSTAASKWTLAAKENHMDDAILEDEDSILKRETEAVSTSSKNMDCGTSDTGKRKACKNCSCGLAEELDKEAATGQASTNTAPKSGCGSCGLGDAFRCASCPYLGQPAFSVASNGAVKLQL
jgi:hypothetical protein